MIKLKDREWNKLLNKIDNEEVVLVLGDELSAVNIGGRKYILKDYILDQLVKDLNDGETDEAKMIHRSDVASFSDISYEYKRERWQNIRSDPYTETTEELKMIKPTTYETGALRKLLSIDKFKTVLTTSFDGIAFSVLKELYGEDNVERYSYERDTNGPDIPIKTDKRLLYQIFGEASSVRNHFVLSEDDLLDFINMWLDANYRPKNLSNLLQDKYILMIGCDYPNWLFRFFFHSLKRMYSTKMENVDNGLLADDKLDPDLVAFLRRMETSVHEDAINFIEELCRRWNLRKKEKRDILQDRQKLGEEDADDDEERAFISYASEDYEEAKEIAGMFGELGLKVWFDKKDLESGDKYEHLIKYKIGKTQAFIPILSPNTENSEGSRFFRKEWKWAKDAEESHFGTSETFIHPVLIGNIKIDSRHVFGDCHCIDLSVPEERMNNIRRMIRKLRK